MYDLNKESIETFSTRFGAKIMPSAEALINSSNVDAVIIASWDSTHADLTLKCIQVNKPVFCKKPLGTTTEECKSVLQAEQASGKQLVQLGFMRRFDPDYLKMKKMVLSGELSLPLMAHCFSRTPRIADTHTTSMNITNIAIHEVDLFRWLLDEEFERVQVLFPKKTSFASNGLQGPQLVIMQSKSGVLIDVEIAANSYYGYEIGCELEHWINFIKGNTKTSGPSSLDGYMASIVTDSLIQSQISSHWEDIHTIK